MARRSKTTGNKRQRERDKRRKREDKEARRQERREQKDLPSDPDAPWFVEPPKEDDEPGDKEREGGSGNHR